ncbi:WD repeat-containing protein 49 [Holothuria leucospilota]|uniref:WD repeat-containing protein 49 n=1 Tax=Holothuria leucospilota TaxID=206669 RepID=A0A9Q1C350_HOLLE|nr:WD repeat-containing protein 49 [Holothuria leucospilota]
MAKRRFMAWYTDLVFMGNVNMVAISSSGRDIKFYDVVAQGFVEIFHLYALQDLPSCLDYWYDTKNPHEESLLLMGSDMGAIHLFYFLKPTNRLFENDGKGTERVQKIWMPELCLHHEFVKHVKLNNIHTEMLRKVQYLPVKNLVISSSGSSQTSVVIADVRGKRRSYVFRRRKGVECYDYSSKLNLILTGGIDHKVLAWNPYMEDKPMAFFLGHQMTVMAVAINDNTKHGYSFSKDGVLKVWDLSEYNCLQTIQIRFPWLWNVKQPDFVHAAMTLHQNQTLVIGFGDYLAQLRVGKDEEMGQNKVVTHNTQLCCAIYNPVFQQVATGADDSTVSVWDLESGSKSLSISEAHGSEEITCMAFSKTGRKLYTGARNGTIKVWNFQNGHNIHQCDPVADAEVTGLVSLGRKKGFLAVGWSRQITYYDDSDSDTFLVKAWQDWRGGQLHTDDILAVDFCPPGLLATASFDGEILIWSSETHNLLFRLRKGQPTQVTQKLKAALSASSQTPGGHLSSAMASSHINASSRPNSRHQISHKTPNGFAQAPVEKLLFLKSRINQGLNDCAVLISSEAGYLHFWSVYDTKHYKGQFYSSHTQDVSTLSLGSDPQNKFLVSGDTNGIVYIWDIQEYCIHCINGESTERPPLQCYWLAHEAAVVSVDVCSMSYGTFILSASTDRTARLWTMSGHYIGTFGQNTKWNLRDPSTYQHPKDPWSVSEQNETGDKVEYSEKLTPPSTGESANSQMAPSDVKPVPSIQLPDFDEPVPATKSSKVDNLHQFPSIDSKAITPSLSRDELSLTPAASTPDISVSRLSFSNIPEDEFRSSSLLRKEVDLKESAYSPPSVLGRHVDRSLARITQSRQQRRERFSRLPDPSALTYGKQCMPFKALVTQETEDLEFLSTLPMTPRMQQQGFFITTESDLHKLTFDPSDSFRGDENLPKEKNKRSSAYLPSI